MNIMTHYFNAHPVSISIAIASAYLSIAILGLPWPVAILAGIAGFFLGQKLDRG